MHPAGTWWSGGAFQWKWRWRSGNLPVYQDGLLGTVTPIQTVTIHTRVDGELIKVAFVEGQIVKKGDLLAEIDPNPFKAQLEQAQGQLAKDQALLKDAQLDLGRYKQAHGCIHGTADRHAGSVGGAGCRGRQER